MNDEPFEVVRCSGNVFADFGYSNAEVQELKALLAAEMIGVLDDRLLTVRKAEELTGIAAADFSRIRKTKLDRFTIDRLMIILNRLDQDVNVRITVRPHLEGAAGTQICRLVKLRATKGVHRVSFCKYHPSNKRYAMRTLPGLLTIKECDAYSTGPRGLAPANIQEWGLELLFEN